jgi:S-DNA-T family DNA segregation ATPase FtsK/SpoIIIE
MFPRAVEIVLETKRGSVSLLQRRLAIGYTRASRLIDLMGIAGIISDHKGSVARDVLISLEEWQAMQQMMEAQAKAEGITLQRDDGPASSAGGSTSLFEEDAPFEETPTIVSPPTAKARVAGDEDDDL